MKTSAVLNAYLPAAPVAQCFHYDAGDVAVCVAKGRARNSFPLKCNVAAVALQTDDDNYRFPPDASKDVCDWCVFSEVGHRACFIELKGSDYIHALEQLISTMKYMCAVYQVIPQRAIAVLSGAHPSNALPGKANAKVKFSRAFPGVKICERSRGQAKTEDALQ